MIFWTESNEINIEPRPVVIPVVRENETSIVRVYPEDEYLFLTGSIAALYLLIHTYYIDCIIIYTVNSGQKRSLLEF